MVIVTPALSDANNGNWQTARRWAQLLAHKHTVRIVRQWPPAVGMAGGPADEFQPDVLLALHAVRSADSIAAWHRLHGSKGLAVVLTGTDLYKDLQERDDGSTRRRAAEQSLRAAAVLVALQDQAPMALPPALRAKTRVIFQSTTARRPVAKSGSHLRAVMVGHLREEKDPLTLMRAAALIPPGLSIRIDHIGAALDPELERQARATAAAHPHYRWLGGLAHEQTRRRIQRAHVLVHTSRLEGGAHVLMEAVRSGTPVLASRMDGNVGMLGRDYPGYFEVGDAQALAQGLLRLRSHPSELAALQAQCEARSALFSPEREQAGLLALIEELRSSA